jgi:hypothetical protein
MRHTTNPEKLTIGGQTYRPESHNATTFFVLNGVVAHSSHPHIQIIRGLKEMRNATDLKTAKSYGITFSSPLAQTTHDRFLENWVGILGQVREANKAGRLWRFVHTDAGESVAVLSFWAKTQSITPTDLDLLRTTFGLTTKVFVEYIDSPDTFTLPTLPLHP